MCCQLKILMLFKSLANWGRHLSASMLILLSLSACRSTHNPSVNLCDKSAVIDISGQKFATGTDPKKSGWLVVECCEDRTSGNANEYTINTNLTDGSSKQWTHFNSGNIEEVRIVKDTADEKVVYVKIKCSEWYKEVKDFDVYFLEINLIARKGVPCLLIHQRVRNPTAQPQKLNFGSYTSGVFSWADSANVNKVDPANKAWIKIVNGGCVWLEKGEHRENKKGLGVISFTPPGFSVFLGHRIFWGYGSKLPVPPGEYVESKMAVMTADTPAELLAIYETIKELKFSEFVTP